MGVRKELSLEDIRAQVEACRGCELRDGRTNVVFGSGNPQAQVFIIGEAPGKNEDLQGVPFVGAAGKYLNELLGYAGLQRDDVYIANVLKCRPPSNRNPKAPEILACSDFLRAQVSAVNPRIIVTLGNFATKFILKTEEGITNLRGTVHFAGRFMVFPVFHPAAAIYDRSKRDVLKEDFTTLGKLLQDAHQPSDDQTAKE